VEKLASEYSKVKSLNTDEEALTKRLTEALSNPLYASFLLAAAKLDDDVRKGAVPAELGDIADVSEKFGGLVCQNIMGIPKSELDTVDVPPFLKQALLKILLNETS